MMLANMQERLESNDLSVHKLRKLLGMVRSPEKLRDLKPAGGTKPSLDGGDSSGNRDKTDKKNRKTSKRKKPASLSCTITLCRASPKVISTHNATLASSTNTMAVLLRVVGNGLLGVSITASTIFDQCEKVANALNPVFKAIKRVAAEGPLLYLDDTTNRIPEQRPVMKKSRDGRVRLRSGIYTSAVLAEAILWA